MWGVSIVDVVIAILRFDGFKEASPYEKLKWIIGYPLALITLLILIIMFIVGTGMFKIKKLFKKK